MFRPLCLFVLYVSVYCWDIKDVELFDLVEEVNANFYEIMQIRQDADISEVKKAYRNLSRVLHPDKNDSPDAEVKFRQLVAIYEVLKDEKRRVVYDRVLVEGLPDWRSPIYYYRRARKMSLLEISVILTVVISITQYLMAWGSYLDKKHTLEEALLRKFKIKDKRKKKNEEADQIAAIEHHLSGIQRPSWWNILPIQLVCLSIFIFTKGPRIVREAFGAFRERKRRQQEEQIILEQEALRRKEEEERRKERRAEQKSRKKVMQNMELYECTSTEGNDVDVEKKQDAQVRPAMQKTCVITGGLWTDDDFSELSRLMAKYPGGTTDRWEKIASQMGRTVYEVTTMSNRVKMHLANKQALEEEMNLTAKAKTKTKGGKHASIEAGPTEAAVLTSSDELWSSAQQKALEKAIRNYPKGTDQRWDKIANCVPGKTKEECILRFKFLAEKIRKRKEEKVKEETVQCEGIEESIEKACESEQVSSVSLSDDVQSGEDMPSVQILSGIVSDTEQ